MVESIRVAGSSLCHTVSERLKLTNCLLTRRISAQLFQYVLNENFKKLDNAVVLVAASLLAATKFNEETVLLSDILQEVGKSFIETQKSAKKTLSRWYVPQNFEGETKKWEIKVLASVGFRVYILERYNPADFAKVILGKLLVDVSEKCATQISSDVYEFLEKSYATTLCVEYHSSPEKVAAACALKALKNNLEIDKACVTDWVYLAQATEAELEAIMSKI